MVRGPSDVIAQRVMAGELCCQCKELLPVAVGKPTDCAKCERTPVPKSRVYMAFERSLDVWRVSLRGPGPLREFTFADSGKLEQMAERGSAFLSLADRQGFEQGVRAGRGGIWLYLTDVQLKAVRIG